MSKFPVDHDLHCHTRLSVCSNDPAMSPEAIIEHAQKAGYTRICLTDHFWDEKVPNPNDFYAVQGLQHVKSELPLPPHEGLDVIFGCETEYRGGEELGLHPDNYNEFGIIVVPLNHFHMADVRSREEYHTEEQVAELFTRRMLDITRLPLPWHKVGLAHLNCPLLYDEGDHCKVLRAMREMQVRALFSFFALKGVGIELNASTFPSGWKRKAAAHLRLFRIAKECGCKFYCASDAHHPEALPLVKKRLGAVADALGLTAEDLWVPQK